MVSRSCCDGVPVMLWWCPGRVVMVSRSRCDGVPLPDFDFCAALYLAIGVSSWASTRLCTPKTHSLVHPAFFSLVHLSLLFKVLQLWPRTSLAEASRSLARSSSSSASSSSPSSPSLSSSAPSSSSSLSSSSASSPSSLSSASSSSSASSASSASSSSASSSSPSLAPSPLSASSPPSSSCQSSPGLVCKLVVVSQQTRISFFTACQWVTYHSFSG